MSIPLVDCVPEYGEGGWRPRAKVFVTTPDGYQEHIVEGPETVLFATEAEANEYCQQMVREWLVRKGYSLPE